MITRALAVLLLMSACGRLEFTPRTDASPFPDVVVQPGCRARSVAVGESHTCVAVENGNVYCTGENVFGGLGVGQVTPQVDTPVLASRLTGTTTVHAGRSFTMGVDSMGAVRCVGANGNDQCGSSGTMHLEPVAPVGLPAVSHLAAGRSFSCARAQSGDTYCWGDADEGQTGKGVSTTGNHLPEVVPSLAGMNATSAAGSTHACAVLPDGGVVCWGDGRDSRLGVVPPDTCPNASDGSIACSLQPVSVPVPPMKAIATGEKHSCAVTLATGEPWCWGANDDRQLGQPRSVAEPPTQVPGVANIERIIAARNNTCVLDASGRMSCWGANDFKQLGVTGASTEQPVVVPLPERVTSIHTGPQSYHVCAVLEGGSVWCWGEAVFGQLGRGPQTDPGLPAPMMLSCP